MRTYTTWLKAAAIVQLLTALSHAATLFVELPATNETEKTLTTLMDTYKFDLGAGFHRTMAEMTLVFSASFGLVNLFGGLINGYLIVNKASREMISPILSINLIVFGMLLVLVIRNTFLMPMLLIGLSVLFLLIARLTINRNNGQT